MAQELAEPLSLITISEESLAGKWLIPQAASMIAAAMVINKVQVTDRTL
jgi:hypothetical protein